MTQENNKKKGLLSDLMPMIIGEAVVAVLVLLGFLVCDLIWLDAVDYLKVALGAVLGALVICINHAVLILSVDREIKKFMDNRPEGEMSEEDARLYTKKQMVSVQNAIRVSSAIRLASMIAMLILAFITGWFNPIATAIPMFAFRVILMIVETIKGKKAPKPDPSKFIKYEDEDDNNKDEKEDK